MDKTKDGTSQVHGPVHWRVYGLVHHEWPRPPRPFKAKGTPVLPRLVCYAAGIVGIPTAPRDLR